MREKAREVIENEISYFVGQSQKRTDSTAEVLKSLSELENAEASKPTIQLPKVAHLNVDFEPLLMQAQVRVIILRLLYPVLFANTIFCSCT